MGPTFLALAGLQVGGILATPLCFLPLSSSFPCIFCCWFLVAFYYFYPCRIEAYLQLLHLSGMSLLGLPFYILLDRTCWSFPLFFYWILLGNLVGPYFVLALLVLLWLILLFKNGLLPWTSPMNDLCLKEGSWAHFRHYSLFSMGTRPFRAITWTTFIWFLTSLGSWISPNCFFFASSLTWAFPFIEPLGMIWQKRVPSTNPSLARLCNIFFKAVMSLRRFLLSALAPWELTNSIWNGKN